MEPLLQNQGFFRGKKVGWSGGRLIVEHLDDRDYFMQKCLGGRLTTERGVTLVKGSVHPETLPLSESLLYLLVGRCLSVLSIAINLNPIRLYCCYHQQELFVILA